MLRQLLMLMMAAAWAVGCWLLRQEEGRGTVLLVWVGCLGLSLLMMATTLVWKAPPLRADPQRVAELARRIDVSRLESHAAVDPARFPVLEEIVLPGHYRQGVQPGFDLHNALAGQVDDVEILVLDVRRKTAENATPPEPETVVIFLSVGNLPPFAVEPAPRMVWFSAGEMQFDSTNLHDDEQRRQVTAFARLYHVLPREGADDAAMRAIFTLDTLTFLTTSPGWSIDSRGGHLVLYRRGRHAGGAELAGFLAEADAIRHQLWLPPGPARQVIPGRIPFGQGIRSLLFSIVIIIAVGGLLGFLGGTLGLAAGIIGMCFGGRPVEWMLEGCYLGAAYGPGDPAALGPDVEHGPPWAAKARFEWGRRSFLRERLTCLYRDRNTQSAASLHSSEWYVAVLDA